MKVDLKLESGEERVYENVERISEGQYTFTIYGEDGVLAHVNKGDVRNLLTENLN